MIPEESLSLECTENMFSLCCILLDTQQQKSTNSQLPQWTYHNASGVLPRNTGTKISFIYIHSVPVGYVVVLVIQRSCLTS